MSKILALIFVNKEEERSIRVNVPFAKEGVTKEEIITAMDLITRKDRPLTDRFFAAEKSSAKLIGTKIQKVSVK